MSLSSRALSSSPRKGLKAEPKKIGFIGIGTMGSVLAKRLISAGHDVVLCSKSQKVKNIFFIILLPLLLLKDLKNEISI